MKPDKQHMSRNCRHTYWARISTTPHVERSRQTAARTHTVRKAQTSSERRIRQVLCQVYVQSGRVPEPSPTPASPLLRLTTPPLSLPLGSCIHAAKMYRFSVSYTQRGVFSILALQTQALATTNKKDPGAEVQRRAAVRSRSETIAGGQKKNTHRKWTKENTGRRAGTWGQVRLAVERHDIVV